MIYWFWDFYRFYLKDCARADHINNTIGQAHRCLQLSQDRVNEEKRSMKACTVVCLRVHKRKVKQYKKKWKELRATLKLVANQSIMFYPSSKESSWKEFKNTIMVL